MGFWGEAGKAWMRSGERQEERAQKEIQQAALWAGLQQQGVVPTSDVDPASASQYKRLGNTRYSIDPDFKAKAESRLKMQKMKPAILLARRQNPTLFPADVPDDQVLAWLENKSLQPDTDNIDPLSSKGIAARKQIIDYENANRPAPQRAPMSPVDTENHLNDLADRAIEAAGGDEQKAIQVLLSDPNTRNVFTQGMGSRHIQAAKQRQKQKQQKGAGGVKAQTAAAIQAILADTSGTR